MLLLALGHHHDRRGGARLLDRGERFEPAHARHLLVEQDGVGLGAQDVLNAVGPIGRLYNVIAFGFEHSDVRREQVDLVVDPENARHGQGSGCRWATTFGTSIVRAALDVALNPWRLRIVSPTLSPPVPMLKSALLTAALVAGCATPPPPQTAAQSDLRQRAVDAVALPAEPTQGASSEFWEMWGDGNAEMSSYDAVSSRYGSPREAELVLIYVTEGLSRSTLVKDDAADDAVSVLKLNISEKFDTGIYPYSVMTSIFSPVDAYRSERFQPVKLTLTAQEWCGHVFRGVWPGADGFRSTLYSYFAGEDESDRAFSAPAGTLYEDALLMQLRELDGPFAGGGGWSGHVVPSLWQQRVTHDEIAAVSATITRAQASRDDQPVTRFVLSYGDYVRTYDVEQVSPHRVIAWETSTGDRAVLKGTDRLPYWRLNGPGEESNRARFGLSTSAN